VRALACVLALAAAAPGAGHIAIVKPQPGIPGVTAEGRTPGTQRLYVHGRLVYRHVETGPFVPLRLSDDGKWLFFYVDDYGAQSAIADGVSLLVVGTRGGPVHDLGRMLPYADYLTWCDASIVFAKGNDRVAIHGKQLVAATPPDWHVRNLWPDRSRSFASPACRPGHAEVAVLMQHSSVDARFFATRWQLWSVGLDGARQLVDRPPAGSADEEPVWSPDGSSLLFVRERNGYGRVMLRTQGRLYGPLRDLGHSLGYYGHHLWGLAWRP
jgi:hypothetical protein